MSIDLESKLVEAGFSSEVGAELLEKVGEGNFGLFKVSVAREIYKAPW